jgi:hypothetical protein
MNFCRTCKYWSVNGHKIGVGTCTNVYAQLRMSPNVSSEFAQNFGCPLHDPGYCTASLHTIEQELFEIRAFLKDRHGITLP